MSKEEFVAWRANQIAYVPKSKIARWFQSRIRLLYNWILKDCK